MMRTSQAAFSLCLSVCVCTLVVPQAQAHESHAHAQHQPLGGFVVSPYVQHATMDSIIVSWETEEPSTSIVHYGRPQLGDEEPRLDLVASSDELATFHHVTLTGLATAEPYFYQASSVNTAGDRITADVRTFKTAVKPEGAYAFAIFGDSQGNPHVWGKVAAHAWGERPDFAIHAGDLVTTGGNKSHWTEQFFPPAEPLMSRVPMFTVLGNHEDDHQLYYDYLAHPDPEYYYTFTYGNAQFFMIDTNRSVIEGTEQYEWLRYQLANSDATWKFMVHHHPPYTSDENDYGNSHVGHSLEGDPAVQDLIPVYEQFGVDIVFFGHIHDYERSWPIAGGRINQEEGVTYLQVGGAGGSLENYAPTRRWHAAKLRRSHHFGIAQVHEGYFRFSAYDDDWQFFDSVDMNKDHTLPTNAEKFGGLVSPPRPLIMPDAGMVVGGTTVSMRSPVAGLNIHYTTDGSEPTEKSTLYAGPFDIEGGTTVRARVIEAGSPPSRIAEISYRDTTPKKSIARLATGTHGLACSTYEGRWASVLDIDGDPVRKAVCAQPTIESVKTRENAWGAVFTGYINIPATGVWTLSTLSDDGTRLYIGGEEVVENDGSHAPRERSGRIALEAGIHEFKLLYFENNVGEELEVFWEGPGTQREEIPARAYFQSLR